MVAKHITKLLLRRYMHRVPYQLRWAKYRGLERISWLKDSLKELKPEVLPEAIVKADDEEIELEPQVFPLYIQPPAPHYHQYRCAQGNPLSCQTLAASSLATCDRCDFPGWLPSGGQLVGKKGQYAFGKRLGHRGMARQYAGVQVSTERPVVIREYLLPQRYFNREEQRQYQEKFTSLAGLSLADGRIQDLRIVTPLEAISGAANAESNSSRCYLVTPDTDSSPSLNQYCARFGPLSSLSVAHVLNQTLQTLTCLHEQKFALPTGQTQTGIIHGNLSLDSLLWVAPHAHQALLEQSTIATTDTAMAVPLPVEITESKGFIYLTDFALWENLFDPAQMETQPLTYQTDLSALGEIAFCLLNGQVLTPEGKPLNPKLDNDWPVDTPAPFKTFVLRLIGIEPGFTSAEAARGSLLRLPPPETVSQYDYRADEILPEKTDWYSKALPFMITAAVLMLGTLGWLLLRSKRPIYADAAIPPCCLESVAAVPTGQFSHASPVAAYWYPLFRNTPETVSRTAESFTPTLFDHIQEIHPELSLNAQAADSIEAAIAAIQSGQAEFAVVPLTVPLPPDITSTIIAYDTLVPVVAFSYLDRAKGLPDSLNGTLTFSQLEQIYTGAINHWQQIDAASLPVKHYWIEDRTVRDFFNYRLFEGASETPNNRSGNNTAASGSLRTPRTEQGSFIDSQIQPQALTSIVMMRSIIQDFENRATGSIGIAPLSEVVGQCSVYPLAISVDGETTSPLVFDDGKAVRPSSDLCDRKGSYGPNADAIRSGDYPLAYPMAVIYPFDNTRSDIGKKIADLLLTQESQQQLVSAGMVSAYFLPETE